MATKKVKWYQKDGTLLHPETDWSMIVGAPEYPDVSKLVTLDTSQIITANKKFNAGFQLPYAGNGTATFTADKISFIGGTSPAYNVLFPNKGGRLVVDTDIPDVSKYLPLSGGTMAGALKFAQSACSDADGPSYLLAMTSFSSGGEVKYTHVRNLTSKGNLQWTSATHTNATGYLFDGNYIPTINTLAYWNGAYQNTSSNLTYCADGEILSKNGGTLTANAQIQRAGISKTWVNGREAAIIRTTSAGSTSSPIYAPIFSQKSANGSWEFGAYTSDIAHLSYVKDTDYNAGNNNQTADYQFAANKKGVVAVMGDITWANTSGKPSWIGSTKPSYTWSEIGSKPSWIGTSKPSYSYSEISGTPTSLKNPSSLSITVNGTTTTYDGSSAQSVSIKTSAGSKLDAWPVGSIYICWYAASSTSAAYHPAKLLGGSWTAIPAGYALWTWNNNQAPTASDAGHEIAQGLPNISGTLGDTNTSNNQIIMGKANSTTLTKTGVFQTSTTYDISGGFGSGNGYAGAVRIVFDASGNNTNGIYGKTTNVQPNAYKVFAWRRTA